MKKHFLFFIIFWVLNNSLLAQCILNCQDGPRANTNIWNYYSTGSGVNEQAVTLWRMYARGPNSLLVSPGNPIGDNTFSMESPFFSTQDNVLKFFDLDFKNWDVRKEDGWEMLIRDFGFRRQLGANCLVTEEETGPQTGKTNPVVVFYNRYTGIMRIFILATQLFGPINEGNNLAEQKGATIQISLLVKDGVRLVSNTLTAQARTQTPADMVLPNQKEIWLMAPNNAVSSIPYWYTADFPMAYDPCICAINETTNLQIKLFLANETNFSINLNTVPLPGANGNGSTLSNTDKNLRLTSVSDVTGVIKTVKEGGKLFKDFGKAANDLGTSFSSSFPDLKFNFPSFKVKGEQWIDFAKAQKKLAFFSDVVPFVNSGLAIIDFFSGFGKSSKSTASSIQLANISLTGTGRMTSYVELEGFNFKLPGASDISGSSLWKPNWDNPMGILTLLETPKIRVETYDKVITKSWTINSNYCPFNGSNDPEDFHSGYIKQRIKLLQPLRIAINPAAGFDLNKSKIEACFEIENVVDYQSMNEQPPTANFFKTFNLTHPTQVDAEGNNVTAFEREGLFVGPSPKRINENGGEIYFNIGNENKFPKYRSAYVNANYLQDYYPSISYNYSEFFGYNNIFDCANGRNTSFMYWYQKPTVYIKLKAKLVPLGATDPKEFTEWIGRFPTKLDPSDFVRINSNPPSPTFSDVAETITIDNPIDCNGSTLVQRQALNSIFVNISQACSGTGLLFKAPNILLSSGVELSVTNGASIELKAESILPTYFNNPLVSESFASVTSWCNSVYKYVPNRIATREAVAFSDGHLIHTTHSKSSLGYPIPNPTKGECSLSFELAEAGGYEMFVSNTLGVRVKKLEHADFAKTGSYKVQFQTDDLEPGVYYITLSANGFRQARKLVVVK
jgi:hypothetical protein